MEEILKCDNCNHSFSGTRIPLILGHCGHTYCKNCVDMRLLANTNGRQCAACQQYSTIQEIKPNIKILKALELINNQELVGAHEDIEGTKIEMGSIRSQNVVMPTKSAHTEITDYSRVYCYMHQERQIEYFCRNCHQLVCPKCMFKDHNGHEFAQLDDVTNVVKQNISDLQKLLENTKRINDDNRIYIENQTQEIQKLKIQQLENIERGFNDVILRLQNKRDQLKAEFSARYDEESNRFLAKFEQIDNNARDIESIGVIYGELQEFVERNTDAKILTKINDISDFMNKSIEDLEQITKNKSIDRAESQIPANLMPLSLNVDKVFDIISRFNMLPVKSGEAK